MPHAGYPNSGRVAASAYALLKPIRRQVTRVVLLGPSHRIPFHGQAATSADGFATPLGVIPIDWNAVKHALRLPQVRVRNPAHKHEHSLEVHLPFLQMTFDDFSLVPFAIGEANVNEGHSPVVTLCRVA